MSYLHEALYCQLKAYLSCMFCLLQCPRVVSISTLVICLSPTLRSRWPCGNSHLTWQTRAYTRPPPPRRLLSQVSSIYTLQPPRHGGLVGFLQPLTQTSHWPAPTATGAPLSGEQQLQSSPPLKQHLVTFAPCQVSSIYSPHQQHLVTGAPLSGKQHLQSSPAAPTVTGAPLSGEQLYSPRQQHIQSQALPCQVSSTYSHRHLHMKFSITLPVSLNFAIMQWDTCFSPWFSNVF